MPPGGGQLAGGAGGPGFGTREDNNWLHYYGFPPDSMPYLRTTTTSEAPLSSASSRLASLQD
jgi:hypothetical protein